MVLHGKQVKIHKQQARLFGTILKSFYGLNKKTLWRLPFETRLVVRGTVYSIMSALNYGSASAPENLDPFEDQ